MQPVLSSCPGLECFSAVLVAMGGTCQQMLLTAASRNAAIKHCNEKWIERGLQTLLCQQNPCSGFPSFSLSPYEPVVMLQSIHTLKGPSNGPRADLGWALLLYRWCETPFFIHSTARKLMNLLCPGAGPWCRLWAVGCVLPGVSRESVMTLWFSC